MVPDAYVVLHALVSYAIPTVPFNILDSPGGYPLVYTKEVSFLFSGGTLDPMLFIAHRLWYLFGCADLLVYFPGYSVSLRRSKVSILLSRCRPGERLIIFHI